MTTSTSILAGRAVLLLLLFSLSGCTSVISNTSSDPVSHDPGKRSLGSVIDDETLELRAMVNINAADEQLKASHISVISYNGYVLIVGQVTSQVLKDKVSEIVRGVRDVRRIYNELEIAGNTTLLARTNDAWISTKVKTSMLADSEIQGLRVKVVTESGVVYLLGLASRSEVERILDSASAQKGVERVVDRLEYID